MIVIALKQFVMEYKLHPILVNFTAALIPVSVASDILERFFGEASLGQTGWWTMAYAGAITPLTALTGWLFWMKDDVGVAGMTVHNLAFALAVVAALVYQGSLGGTQVFKDM